MRGCCWVAFGIPTEASSTLVHRHGRVQKAVVTLETFWVSRDPKRGEGLLDFVLAEYLLQLLVYCMSFLYKFIFSFCDQVIWEVAWFHFCSGSKNRYAREDVKFFNSIETLHANIQSLRTPKKHHACSSVVAYIRTFWSHRSKGKEIVRGGVYVAWSRVRNRSVWRGVASTHNSKHLVVFMT